MITLFWSHYCAAWRGLAFRLTLPLSAVQLRRVARFVEDL